MLTVPRYTCFDIATIEEPFPGRPISPFLRIILDGFHVSAVAPSHAVEMCKISGLAPKVRITLPQSTSRRVHLSQFSNQLLQKSQHASYQNLGFIYILSHLVYHQNELFCGSENLRQRPYARHEINNLFEESNDGKGAIEYLI